MNPKDYRKQMEDLVEQKRRTAPPEPSAAALRATVLDRTADPKDRCTAIGKLGSKIHDDDELLAFATTAIADANEPLDVRLAALAALQLASVTAPKLKVRRPAYLNALRTAVDNSTDTELRWRALGVLAREKDAGTQARLIDGLRNPANAIVDAEKALQLLSYDVKSTIEAADLLREIAQHHPSQEARVEALRLLAVDAGSHDLLEHVIRDRGQAPDVRQTALAALHSLDPQGVRRVARDVVLDPSESEELQQCGVAALALDPNDAEDDELTSRITSLANDAPSDSMKQSARQYLEKRKR